MLTSIEQIIATVGGGVVIPKGLSHYLPFSTSRSREEVVPLPRSPVESQLDDVKKTPTSMGRLIRPELSVMQITPNGFNGVSKVKRDY